MLIDKSISVSRIENGYEVDYSYQQTKKNDPEDTTYESKKYAFVSLQDTAKKVNELLTEL